MPAATLSQLPRTSLDRPGRRGPRRHPSIFSRAAAPRAERPLFLVERTAAAIGRRFLIALIPIYPEAAAPSQARVSEVHLFGRECCPSASRGHIGHNGEIFGEVSGEISAAAASRFRPRKNGPRPGLSVPAAPAPRLRYIREGEALNCDGQAAARRLSPFSRKPNHSRWFRECGLSIITKLIISYLTVGCLRAAMASKS